MGEFFVYNSVYTGKCYWMDKRSRISGVFSYDDEYLTGTDNWNIQPSLPLVTGAQPFKDGLPGVFRDASPDRWGQVLIRHRHLQESKRNNRSPRTINEVDYLLGVSDFTRQGDLRFSLEKDGAFQHPSNKIPQLTALSKLFYAANHYITEKDEDAITYLLDAGSASLGGARPKAAVYDGNDLYIAKFPHKHDEWDVIAWEWTALMAASQAGINVSECRLVEVDKQNVLLTKRFDRDGQNRFGYISMMTLLELNDGDHADYYEIAEKLRDVSVCAKNDLHELFRRIVFNLLINNTDDHLRNHGLLRSGSGWRLSPAFDINPNPDTSAARATSVFSETAKEAALSSLLANADTFDLTLHNSEKIISEVSAAITSCNSFAQRAGIKKEEREMILRFIHI